MAAHLPELMIAGGATLATAVLVGALVGPAQVAARVLEFSVLRKIHPLLSARLAALMHPVGALLLLTFGIPVATGNGILTKAHNLVRWWPSIFDQAGRIQGGAAFRVPWKFSGRFEQIR